MARPRLDEDEIEAFRQRIVEVAMRLFAEHGYDGVSLRRLAAALGCSHAAPYRYFKDKDEIFAAVRAEGFHRFAKHLRAALAEVSDPIERVRTLGLSYFAFAQQHPEAFRTMFELAQRDEGDARPWSRQAAVEAWMILRDTTGEAIEAGVLTGSTTTTAHLLWASIHGITTLHLAQKLTMGRDADALVAPMIEALIRAHTPEDRP